MNSKRSFRVQKPVTTQSDIDRQLVRALVFSVIWLMGFGSLYAVVTAFQAHRAIRRSGGELTGLTMVWWCYAVGGLGVIAMSQGDATVSRRATGRRYAGHHLE